MTTQRTLDVEAFSLYGDDDAGHVHFEDDGNLFVHYQPEGRGTYAGLVMVELGIDGYRTHRVRTDVRRHGEDAESFNYGGDRLAALNDAIEALTAVRDQIEVMRTPAEARGSERNAFEIGRDVGRDNA